jgi:hypothetical protein
LNSEFERFAVESLNPPSPDLKLYLTIMIRVEFEECDHRSQNFFRDCPQCSRFSNFVNSVPTYLTEAIL